MEPASNSPKITSFNNRITRSTRSRTKTAENWNKNFGQGPTQEKIEEKANFLNDSDKENDDMNELEKLQAKKLAVDKKLIEKKNDEAMKMIEEEVTAEINSMHTKKETEIGPQLGPENESKGPVVKYIQNIQHATEPLPKPNPVDGSMWSNLVSSTVTNELYASMESSKNSDFEDSYKKPKIEIAKCDYNPFQLAAKKGDESLISPPVKNEEEKTGFLSEGSQSSRGRQTKRKKRSGRSGSSRSGSSNSSRSTLDSRSCSTSDYSRSGSRSSRSTSRSLSSRSRSRSLSSSQEKSQDDLAEQIEEDMILEDLPKKPIIYIFKCEYYNPKNGRFCDRRFDRPHDHLSQGKCVAKFRPIVSGSKNISPPKDWNGGYPRISARGYEERAKNGTLIELTDESSNLLTRPAEKLLSESKGRRDRHGNLINEELLVESRDRERREQRRKRRRRSRSRSGSRSDSRDRARIFNFKCPDSNCLDKEEHDHKNSNGNITIKFRPNDNPIMTRDSLRPNLRHAYCGWILEKEPFMVRCRDYKNHEHKDINGRLAFKVRLTGQFYESEKRAWKKKKQDEERKLHREAIEALKDDEDAMNEEEKYEYNIPIYNNSCQFENCQDKETHDHHDEETGKITHKFRPNENPQYRNYKKVHTFVKRCHWITEFEPKIKRCEEFEDHEHKDERGRLITKVRLLKYILKDKRKMKRAAERKERQAEKDKEREERINKEKELEAQKELDRELYEKQELDKIRKDETGELKPRTYYYDCMYQFSDSGEICKFCKIQYHKNSKNRSISKTSDILTSHWNHQFAMTDQHHEHKEVINGKERVVAEYLHCRYKNPEFRENDDYFPIRKRFGTCFWILNPDCKMVDEFERCHATVCWNLLFSKLRFKNIFLFSETKILDFLLLFHFTHQNLFS